MPHFNTVFTVTKEGIAKVEPENGLASIESFLIKCRCENCGTISDFQEISTENVTNLRRGRAANLRAEIPSFST